MTDHCIIRADFSATRTVAGRKIIQLIFEAPIEAADDVLAKLGGFPQPGTNRWCAIALLDATKLGREQASSATNPDGEREVSDSATTTQGHDFCQCRWNEAEAPRHIRGERNVGCLHEASQAEGGSHKKWSEYTRSQQAFMLCRDEAFWAYFGALDAEHCDRKLKAHFRIATKKAFDSDPHMEARWDEFVALYHMYRQRGAG